MRGFGYFYFWGRGVIAENGHRRRLSKDGLNKHYWNFAERKNHQRKDGNQSEEVSKHQGSLKKFLCEFHN